MEVELNKSIFPVLLFILIISTPLTVLSNTTENSIFETDSIEIEEDYNFQPVTINNNFIDHIWPTQGYNRKHVGRSPYSTEDNLGIEKWRFPAKDWCDGSPIIDRNGTIYFGSVESDDHLYAIYPNGTLKWKFEAESGIGDFGSSPAIADDGAVYIGTTFGSYIHAVNPNGTGKWKRKVPEIDTSITIDSDGIIYYGHHEGVDARYPNGTLKWRFQPNDFVQSTPAIDDNGIIYFGSHDSYIYAIYPNGTMKWKFDTDSWVHGSPSIGTDGTVYCGSDDAYLYAINPDNGSMIWKCKLSSGMRASPSIDKDGNLYCGVSKNEIYSIYPNGTIRWNFTIDKYDGVWGSTCAISDDGTLYVGTHINIGSSIGGEILALNFDGSLKWRKKICDGLIRSSPAISDNGNVFICSSQSGKGPDAWGYLHCFGAQENNNPPSIPTITGPDEVKVRDWRTFKFKSSDEDNNPISFYIDWGDGNEGWTRDYEPNLTVPINHRWNIIGNYKIKAKARDTFGAESDWGYFKVTVPKSYILDYYGFLERFPLLQRLLERLI